MTEAVFTVYREIGCFWECPLGEVPLYTLSITIVPYTIIITVTVFTIIKQYDMRLFVVKTIPVCRTFIYSKCDSRLQTQLRNAKA